MKEIVGLDKAKVFWGLAKDNALMISNIGLPMLWNSKPPQFEGWAPEYKPVKVYILVEDKA